jgi:hypothetical protein
MSIDRQGMLGRPEEDPIAIVNAPAQNYSNVGVGMLEQARLSGDGFSVGQDFVNKDLAQRENTSERRGFEFGIGEDARQVQSLGGTPRFVATDLGGQYRSNLASGGNADLRALLDQETAGRLGDMGLQGVYEQDEYKGYKYNPSTGKYDYYDSTPSTFEQYAPVLIKAGITTALTAGVGGALAGSSLVTGVAGGNAAVAGAIGQGVASGAMTAIQGGEGKDILKSTILGAASGGAKAATKAVKAAEAAGASTEALNSLKATADIANRIGAGIKGVNAIQQGNVLGAVSGTLSVSGIGSLETATGDLLKNTGISQLADNAKELSPAILKGVDFMIKGAEPEEAIVKGMIQYVKEGGSLSSLMPEGGGKFDIDLVAPEWISELADKASQINKEYVKPMVETISATVDKGVDAVRETGRDIREAVDPVADTVREAGRDVREAVDPAANAVRDAGRAVKDFAEDNNLLDKAGNLLSRFGGALFGGSGGASSGGGGGGGQAVAQQQYVPRKEFKPERTELVQSQDLLRNSAFRNPLMRG